MIGDVLGKKGMARSCEATWTQQTEMADVGGDEIQKLRAIKSKKLVHQ